MFTRILKRSSWIDIIISIIFILLGILLIKKPEETLKAISTILGIIFVAMGVLKLIQYFTEDKKDDYLLVIALVTVIFGTIVIFASNTILSVFKLILGIWIIATGVMDFQITLIWKDFKSPSCIISILFSILIMFVGIIILINENILTTTLGIIIIIYGILDLIDRLIFMKKVGNYIINKDKVS